MQVKCISCGATQKLNDEKKCEYCSGPIEIESGKTNYQKAMQGETGNLMAMAEVAIEATNWDEALQFFNRVLEKDITNTDAWLGKGIAIVYTSKIADLKIKEAITYWKNAIKHASNQDAVGKRVAKEINEVVSSFYPTLENHFIQFKDLDNSYQELVSKFSTLENALEYATTLDSQNINYYETGYALCKRVIGVPNAYAIADYGSALAGTIVGSLQQNKYKQQDALSKGRNATARKNEINEASKIVDVLEEKYISHIKKLNPNSRLVSSRLEIQAVQSEKKKKTSRMLWIFVGVILLYVVIKGLLKTWGINI